MIKTTFWIIVAVIAISLAVVTSLELLLPDAPPLDGREISLLVFVVLVIVLAARAVWRAIFRRRRNNGEA